MQYSLNYSGTRFLPTGNQKLLNFLMDSVLKCYTGFVRRTMTLYSKECNTSKISSNGKSLYLTNIVCFHRNLHKRP